MEEDITLLKSLGLSEQKAKETLKNLQVTSNIKLAISEALKFEKIEKINGILIYHLASNIKTQILDDLPLVSKYIAEKKLDSVLKVDAAIAFLLNNNKKKFNIADFEVASGIGVEISSEEIEAEVEKSINKYKNEIIEKRYHFNSGLLMQEVRNALKWADGKIIKAEIDVQLFDLLGEKSKTDLAKPKKTKPEAAKNALKTNSIKNDVKPKTESMSFNDLIRSKIHFHKPGENYKTDGYVLTDKTHELLEKHLKITGGEVRTRFPPEPNGILHVGHAKAININFGYASAYNGSCYLRYDDTNPEKEEEKFVTSILDMVQWLGYKPTKITYSSDNFDQLYNWAVCLIKKGLAYVCHQTSNEMKGFNPPPSPWRDRPISESLIIFQDMKDGLLNEGEATLRMKVTLEEGKQDPVAYRIKFSEHHRTGKNWCIYPTYDFTHCLCDSIENITHSLCTKEFQSRRSSYYWLCNALDIYCPVQWEYGRLNVSYTVVSKRKIAKLIEKKIVSDWDDPRLFTLTALKRRGYPPQAINNFCAQVGVTGAQAVVDPIALEAAVRDTLNEIAPRYMVVFEPIKLIIENFPSEGSIELEVLNFPGEPNKGNHLAVFDREIYIDSSDFQEEADKNYKRLTLNQSVGLKYAGVVLSIKEIVKDNNGSINYILVSQEPISDKNKPKAFIQWVAQPSIATVNLYEKLFQHKNPEDLNEVPNGFLSDINYNSKKEVVAYIDKQFEKIIKPFDKFQFERIGFFSVDPDSKPGKVIFNRTVTLKETPLKV